MPRESASLLAGRRVPETQRRVIAGGDQRFSVRRKDDAGNGPLVALENLRLLARLCVPQSDRPISTARSQQLAIGREGDSVDNPSMSAKREERLGRRSNGIASSGLAFLRWAGLR